MEDEGIPRTIAGAGKALARSSTTAKTLE